MQVRYEDKMLNIKRKMGYNAENYNGTKQRKGTKNKN